jgi:ribonucleoside-diphosphate reductase alpha chain
MGIMVTKRDGSREPYEANKINRALENASRGLPDQISMVVQVATEVSLTLFDGITTEQLDEAVIQTALQNVKDDPEFDVIAARLLLKTIYKKVLGDYETEAELVTLHQRQFPKYIKAGIKDGYLDMQMQSAFDLPKLAKALKPDRDQLMKYIGVVTTRNRYSLRDQAGETLEVPQYTLMRVAMGLSYNESDPTAAAIKFYDKMSSLDYLPGGSTRVNAGTQFPQLANCFVMEMQDDIEHIAKTNRDVMWMSKGTGGIGLSVTKLRAEGSPVKSTNTVSTGPIPFMHTVDSILRAVSRKGKKAGALAFYMENWHIDFPQFLDIKENSGDPYRRTRTANTAVWISDEFMKRVADDSDWYLFDPAEVPELNELYGQAFSDKYAAYIQQAEAGNLRVFSKLKAREQLKSILITLQTTSHPWLTWKDTINNRALNNNTGTIHLSNLCTEICLPQDRDNIAVCNLASINLSTHLLDEPGDFDWRRLEASVRLAVRQLDNLIDITASFIPESNFSNDQNRAIGLGIMGFTDVTERLGMAYESEAAYGLIDKLMEFISYQAIDESANLARERGTYANFAGSGWSQGLVPFDTMQRAAKDRGVKLTVDMSSTLDWAKLRRKVKGGIRNATLMAIAPTANMAQAAGTTPGIDPQFSQIFSRTTLNGKFLEVNQNLVNDLKELGLWDEVKEDILRAQGDIQLIEVIPDRLKAVYRTSFQVSPTAFIEVAARAQKWIDQAISRNMYLETRDIGDMMDIYRGAWEKGLKTTYYLHMKPRHSAEQSTVKVNKSEAIQSPAGAFGFSFSK